MWLATLYWIGSYVMEVASYLLCVILRTHYMQQMCSALPVHDGRDNWPPCFAAVFVAAIWQISHLGCT